jgi:hypothetical protein
MTRESVSGTSRRRHDFGRGEEMMQIRRWAVVVVVVEGLTKEMEEAAVGAKGNGQRRHWCVV